MSKSIFKSQFITILAHLSAWGLFFCVPILLRGQEMPPQHLKELPLTMILMFGSLLITVFYVNFWLLIPLVLNRFGTRFYILSVLLLWLAFTLISVLLKNFLFGNAHLIPYAAFTFPFLLIVAMSLSIHLLIDKSKMEQQQKERENETLKSELSFLRSQISPHFLFNVMNNVVALSRLKPEKVEPTLIQLSHLMRYMLYNSDEKKVRILNEINYLESYIELQKLRFDDSINLVFTKNYKNTEGGLIEPMLLIPFVENAFKHGVGTVENSSINITLSLRDNILIFNVLNNFDPLSILTQNSDSGIGLKNVSRRLELLYGTNKSLKISDENGIFKVDLMINLKN